MKYLICPKCGEQNPSTLLYCSGCGASLKQANAVESGGSYVSGSDFMMRELKTGADEGRIKCGLIAHPDSKEIRGARCYLYENSQACILTAGPEGLHFGEMLFWRGNKSRAVGGGMQNMSLVSLIFTGATTESVALQIAWADLQGCLVSWGKDDNSQSYISLIFNNPRKKRSEWLRMAFGVQLEGAVKTSDTEWQRRYQEVFLELCRQHNVPVEEETA